LKFFGTDAAHFGHVNISPAGELAAGAGDDWGSKERRATSGAGAI